MADQGRQPIFRQRTVNMYLEPTPQGPTQQAKFGRPGLVSKVVRGNGPIRATFLWNGYRYVVSGGDVWRDNVLLGAILSAGRCRFAFSDDEIVLVSGGRAWRVDHDSIAPILGAGLPGNTVDVTFIAGRFVYLDGNSDKFYWSALGDAMTIDGLSFASAAENTADFLSAVAVTQDQLIFFLGKSGEWWYPQSDLAAPYARSPGRKYDKGLGAQGTVVDIDNTIYFMGEDRIVYRAAAVPIRASTFEIEDFIRRVSDADLPNCSAFGIVIGGHPFYVLNLIGQSTWAYDISTKQWFEWATENQPNFQVLVSDSSYAIMGDSLSGNLLTFDGGTYTDLGQPIARVCSLFTPLPNGQKRNFNLMLAAKRGVGTVAGNGSDPVVEMRFSDDESNSWSNWMTARLGIQGEATENAKAIWMALGSIRSPGRLFEFRCSDPVNFVVYDIKVNTPRP